MSLDNIPLELRQKLQWVGWKYGNPRADGTRPKPPINPHTGEAAKPNDPATWGDYQTAQAAVERCGLEGVGFMFADDGGLTGIDFDNCIIDDKMTPEVEGVLRILNSYTEISPSGEGVKVWIKGTKPAGAKCVRKRVLGCKRVEIYDKGRFFTVTGRQVPGIPVTVAARQADLNDLCAELWPELKTTDTTEAVAVKLGTVGQTVIPSSAVSQFVGGRPDVMDRCWACLLKMRRSVSGECGHNDLLAAACTCFRFGLSSIQAREILARFNRERCDPPWPDAELDRKVAEGFKKVEADGQFGMLLNKPSKGKGKGKGNHRWHNQLPEWVFEIPGGLRPYPRAILQAIADKCDRHPIDGEGSLGTAIVGFKGLAKLCSISERTVARHIKRLRAMGMLVRVSKGAIRWDTGEVLANTYRIPGKFGALDGMTESQSPPPPNTGLPDDSM